MLIPLLGIFCNCETKVDDSSVVAFEKNSATVMEYLNGFQKESLDYEALYSENAIMLDTKIGAEHDSMHLAEIILSDQAGWDSYDFEILGTINLLPGVNSVTKQVDGSVRYYGTWRTIKAATDSTAAIQSDIRLYESFDFDAAGKILYQQYYGDLTASGNVLKGK